jgi:hypothetical protein
MDPTRPDEFDDFRDGVREAVQGQAGDVMMDVAWGILNHGAYHPLFQALRAPIDGGARYEPLDLDDPAEKPEGRHHGPS